ncbi:MAG: elongation factor G [Kofleriaceae bacterium]|nr:elongation factor G [Myxococcales bacterium]MCB9564292.1 elongation factor G [Kofleriaceae bacterium]MCB9570945.1 elongation factor G [Kofleriaceae bacterium]
MATASSSSRASGASAAPTARIRNIGILAHIDAGKTTTTERVLFYSGVISRIGEVHDGAAFTDWMEQEQERGISITAASTTFGWRDHQVNLIDTPGHVDFTVEVERSLRVLDGAIVVIDAVAGVQPQTETVWRQADRYGVPRLAFVNKCDREGADVAAVLEGMAARLDVRAALLQLPYAPDDTLVGVIDLLRGRLRVWDDASMGMSFEDRPVPAELAGEVAAARDRLLEAVAEADEAFLDAYLAGSFGEADVVAALRRATLARRLVPTLVGAAYRNQGVHDLLDAVVDLLPSPADLSAVAGRHPETGEVVTRRATDEGPLAALAFKIMPLGEVDSEASRSGAQLTYLRVYSGRLRVGQSVLNATKGRLEQIGRLVRMHANHREEVVELGAGHIGAIVGVRTATTGDTLCDPTAPILLDTIQFPSPVIGVAIEADSEAGQARLDAALARLAEEDPSFRVRVDPDSLQTVISGMGELHLEVLVDRLRREHGVDVRVGQPRVAYRETVTARAEAEKVHPRLGPAVGFGHVKLLVEPSARGAGYTFEEQALGAVPRRYLPAVAAGVGEAVDRGVLAGYPMTDLRVTLVGGSEHPVDSSDSGYKFAGFQAFVEAARHASPTLLEPVMDVEVITPDSFVGDVIGDLHARRGKITGIASRHGVQTVASLVPLAAMFGYATDLRSRTQGRATYSMQFRSYAEVPHGIRDELVSAGRRYQAR